MNDEIKQLPNGDFEVLREDQHGFHSEVKTLDPYVFARDLEIELKIANDKRRKDKEGSRNKGEDYEGFRERNHYVPGGEWGHGLSGD